MRDVFLYYMLLQKSVLILTRRTIVLVSNFSTRCRFNSRHVTSDSGKLSFVARILAQISSRFTPQFCCPLSNENKFCENGSSWQNSRNVCPEERYVRLMYKVIETEVQLIHEIEVINKLKV